MGGGQLSVNKMLCPYFQYNVVAGELQLEPSPPATDAVMSS